MALLRIATVLSALCHSGAHDYIIVGAGSAGLQMGLFMERAEASYMIYERGEQAGSFWKTYPVTEELISVNSNDPSERYDWHTLLESPVPFRNFSTRFFPLRSEFHDYLNAVAATLRVEYSTEVLQILDGPCVLLSGSRRECARRRVFIGTGLEPVPRPNLERNGVVPYTKFDAAMVDGEKVCILGNGNSAWEMAQASFSTARSVAVLGRRATRWSIVTKYVSACPSLCSCLIVSQPDRNCSLL